MTGQARSQFLYYIIYSFYNRFIATLRVSAELDISVLINLFNHNIILHGVLMQLHGILTARTLTTVNFTQFFVRGENYVIMSVSVSPVDH